MKRSLPILAATVLLAGCGSSGPSAQDQIRANELKYLTGYIAGSVSQCQYVEQPAAKCEDSVRRQLAAGINPSFGFPADWRARVSHAKVIINGNHATINYTFPQLPPTSEAYVKQNGRWVVSG